MTEHELKQHFARLLLERITALTCVASASYNEAAFEIDVICEGTEGLSVKCSLGNRFTEWVGGDDAGKEKSLEISLKAVLEAIARLRAPSADEDQFLPLLITESGLFSLQVEALSDHPEVSREGRTFVAKRFVGDLWVRLVEDKPETIMQVTGKMLEDANLSEDAAWTKAMANFAALQPLSWTLWQRDFPGTYLSSSSFYSATHMMRTDFAKDLEINGDPVVIPLGKGQVILTGSNDANALTKIFLLIVENIERIQFSVTPLRRAADGTWSVFEPAVHGGHFRSLRSRHLAHALGQEAAALRKLGYDLPICELGMTHIPTAHIAHTAVWPINEEVLMPKADLVRFVVNGKSETLPFDVVRAAPEFNLQPLPVMVPWFRAAPIPLAKLVPLVTNLKRLMGGSGGNT